MKKVKPGIYIRAEGGLCWVRCMARHCQTQEEMVVYHDAADEEKNWACPAAMWDEEVDVGDERQPRFVYLAPDLNAVDGMRAFTLIEQIKEHMEMYDHMGEDNWLAFYHRPTGKILSARRYVLGALEDGEEPEIYDDSERENAEWILEHWDQCVRLPDEFDEYQEMENFIDELPLPYQEPLERAITGKGAFRRFRETADRLRLLEHWHVYRDAAYRREARAWCEANEIDWWKERL